MKLQSVLIAFTALGSLFLSAQETEHCSPWTGSVDFGGNYLSGNTDLLHIYGGAKGERKLDDSTLLLGIEGVYGKSNGVKNAEWIHGYTQYNYNFSDRFYGGLFTDAWHDEIADLRYRFTVSPLLGYYLIKTDSTTLAIEAGPSYVFEEQAGITDSYFALRFAERFEHHLSDSTRIWQSLEYRPESSDFGNYLLIGEAGIQTWVSRSVSAKAFVQNRYDSEPEGGREENDLGFYFALSYGNGQRPGYKPSANHSAGDDASAWKFTGSAGGSFLSGNTEATAFSSALTGLKKSDGYETGLGINGGYGETGTTVTAQQLGGYLFRNYDLDERWYLGARTDVFHDSIALLDYRINAGLNIGYRFINEPCTSLKFEAGPGYIWEDQNGFNSYGSIRFGEYFNHSLAENVKLFQSSEYLASLEDFEDYLWVNKGGVDLCIRKGWAWSNAVVHTYDNTPAAGNQESDLSIVSGIKWSF